ncbi:MAG: hypothetical protein Q8N98_02625, partial [bacterium]|nr:hypothetical protein [bacterium]
MAGDEERLRQPEGSFSAERKVSFLRSLRDSVFSQCEGLLIQAELVFHYQQVEDFVLGKEKSRKRISPYYRNKTMGTVLCMPGASNLLAAPCWRELGLHHFITRLDREQSGIETDFLGLIARKKFSGQVPPSKDDLDGFLESLREQELITIDDRCLESAV